MPLSSLDNFTRASDAIFKFEMNFNKIRDEDHHVYTIEVMTDELKSLWTEAKTAYNECLEDLGSSTKTKPEIMESAEGKYQSTLTAYARCIKTMRVKSDELKAETKTEASIAGKSETMSGNTGHNLPLPPCNIEIFSGDYLSWPTFRDLFTALYINNNRISDIERLCYLMNRTGKDAREIVAKCPLTNAGFDIAWKKLRETYENPRMLVNNQLKCLFGLEAVTKESSTALKNLQRGIDSFLTAMSVYDISTENWDPIIVFICIQRLPAQTVTLWEQSIKDKTALSLWKDLDLFLTERIQTLDCIRDLTHTETGKRGVEKRVNVHVSNTNNNCTLCSKQSHVLRFCPKFRKMSISERFSFAKKHRCCLNCLSKSHEVKDCRSEHRCFTCNQRHHTLLHRRPASDVTAVVPATESSNSHSVARSTGVDSCLPSTSANARASTGRQVFHVARNSSVLLGTAMVSVHCHGTTYPARALIDSASEASFISEHLRNQLRLPSHSTSVMISGVNGEASTTSKKLCPVKIGSPLDSDIEMSTLALVLPSISGNLPSFVCPRNLTDELLDLPLADRFFYESRPVDLLLGADLYPDIILGEVRRGIGSLIAQNTVFGWILLGPIDASAVHMINTFSTRVTPLGEDTLDQTLLRFWELEEVPKPKVLSYADQICEDLYRRTTVRDSMGRYVVTLPFRPEFPDDINLGISRSGALAQWKRIEASLHRKPEVRRMYDDVLKDYLQLDHMRPITPTNRPVSSVCYLPHHPVIKPERKTTKLRVVFNASNRTSNGKSLNDCLFVGPSLQTDLITLILRWRLFRFVFNCDVTKMYRQIRVHSDHTPYQRILYGNTADEGIKDYELQTVTFGLNCAPYLAIRTLLQLADDCERDFPLASRILRRDMYVDDVLSGAHDALDATAARDQLIVALRSAGFELRKWTSNDELVLKGLPEDYLLDAKLLEFDEASCSRTLGIFWNARSDSFFFRADLLEVKSEYTKREVLSIIAKFYDPVGWLGPVVVVAKMIMQRIWKDGTNWDDGLVDSTKAEWLKFVREFEKVNSIRIPRWVKFCRQSTVQLHVFSDASEKAYAGAIYIRVRTANGDIYTNLLASKTRVAPIKSISLPRLELCGAVLASELLKNVLREIEIPIHRVFCWTDSTIVLAWLRKAPCSWTTFVANRVCRIQENSGSRNWFHVRSEDNPADLGSRGVDPFTLSESNLWWKGPKWLEQNEVDWNLDRLDYLDTDVERKGIKVCASFFSNFEDVLNRFSSLDRALRVIAYIFRFCSSTRPAKYRRTYEDHTVTGDEIKMVKLRLAIIAQKACFAEEYKDLLERRPLSSKSSLLPLNPFLDERGVMRLNGRLSKSPSLSYREQYPIILPYGCRFARLMAEFIHKLSIHGGNQLMLRIFRCEYWIPRMKTLIRTVIRACKRCIMDKRRSCTQIMAALPPERTTLDRPFATTGVDFAGPFDVKTYTGRSCRITKGYVCIFVCFSTKAIHLEATSDLSTDTFLQAFNRFISRRGCPHTVFSDNGTNFVGASNEMARDFRIFLKECQARMCSSFGYQGLTWKFIPAGAPHMGGLWEAGVRSFKLHFRKEAQACRFTFEELTTVLARIEACLNSRPLCPMPDNPGEPVALTPGHFLIGTSILAPPEPTIYDSPLSAVNRYRRVKALIHEFCKRWKEEYLVGLHKRYKWQHPQRDVAIDDLVVVRNEQFPATSWKLGIVLRTHPGADGHVRVADIRTQNGIITRPITKLVVLNELL